MLPSEEKTVHKGYDPDVKNSVEAEFEWLHASVARSGRQRHLGKGGEAATRARTSQTDVCLAK